MLTPRNTERKVTEERATEAAVMKNTTVAETMVIERTAEIAVVDVVTMTAEIEAVDARGMIEESAVLGAVVTIGETGAGISAAGGKIATSNVSSGKSRISDSAQKGSSAYMSSSSSSSFMFRSGIATTFVDSGKIGDRCAEGATPKLSDFVMTIAESVAGIAMHGSSLASSNILKKNSIDEPREI